MRVLALIAGWLTALVAHAQTDTTRFLTVAPVAAYTYVRDAGMSPLRYQGIGLGGQIGYRVERPRWLTVTNASFHYGTLSAAFGPNFSLTGVVRSWRGTYEDTYLYAVGNAGPVRFRAGGGLSFVSSYRIHQAFSNNQENYEHFGSLHLGGQVAYPFQLFGRRFRAESFVVVPWLSGTVRPGFASDQPAPFLDGEGTWVGDALRSVEVTSFGGLGRLRWQTGLLYWLRNGNRLGLYYTWDYYRVDGPHRVRAATHALRFQLFFEV